MGRSGSPAQSKTAGNSLSHWYVAAARRVLRPHDGFFVLGFVAHGMGQIAVVLVAAGCAKLVAEGAVSADPHESQKRLPIGLVEPHFGQMLLTRSAPQEPQNRAPTRFTWPQA